MVIDMTDSEKIDLILSKVGNLETKVDNLETKVDNLEANLQDVRKKVINTELLLENEIRVNIQRIAEGHLDLSRNLHDALKLGNEKEMLAIRVNVLESEIRRIKTHLDIA